MMNIAYLLFWILLFTISPSELFSKDKVYYYDNFIKDVINNNQTIEAINKSFLVEEGKVLASKALEDYFLTAKGGYIKKEFYSSQFSPLESSQGLTGDVSLSHQFVTTGTSVSLSYQLSGLNNSLSSTAMTPAMENKVYSPSVILILNQPLLRNFLGTQSRFPMALAKHQKDIAYLTQNEVIESILFEATNVYLKWYLAKKQIEIINSIIGRVKKQRVLVRDQLKDGLSEKEDLLRIDEALYKYKANLDRLNGALKSSEYMVSSLLSNKKKIDFKSKLERPYIPSPQDKDLPKGTRIRKILSISEDLQKTILTSKENNKLPDLSLVASLKRYGQDDSISKASKSSFSKDDIFVGLELALPILRKEKEGAYLSEYYTLQKIRLENMQKIVSLENILSTLVDNIDSLYRSTQNYQHLLDTARKKNKILEKRFKQGRISLFQLLSDQMNFLSNELTYVELQVESDKLKAQYNEITDQLWENGKK